MEVPFDTQPEPFAEVSLFGYITAVVVMVAPLP